MQKLWALLLRTPVSYFYIARKVDILIVIALAMVVVAILDSEVKCHSCTYIVEKFFIKICG